MEVTEHDVHDALVKALGREPLGWCWRLLVKDGYVDEARRQDVYVNAFTDLLNRYMDLEGVVDVEQQQVPDARKMGTLPARASSDQSNETTEFSVLSEIIATLANEHPGVTQFRAEYLKDGNVNLSEVHPWVTEAASNEGPKTEWARVPIAPDGTLDVERVDKTSLMIPETTTLSYFYGDEFRFGSIDIHSFGTLAMLKSLGWHLSVNFGWDEAAAVTFVLCDNVIPNVLPVTVDPAENADWRLSSLATIGLEVNLGMSPNDLLDAYKKIRNSIAEENRKSYGFGRERLTRRRLSGKHLELARVAKWNLAVSEPLSWNELLRRWNKVWAEDHPDWRYDSPTHLGNFIRDSKAAFERVVGTDKEGLHEWLSRFRVRVGDEDHQFPILS